MRMVLGCCCMVCLASSSPVIVLKPFEPHVTAIESMGSFDLVASLNPPKAIKFVEFYKPSCHFCRIFKHMWSQMASRFGKKVADADSGAALFYSVDCEAHRPICKQNRVHAYPTIIAFGAVNEGELLYTEVKRPRNLIRWFKKVLELP